MFLFGLFSLLIPLTTATYRDNTKTMKSLPAFTNSLVNLGKMDLSFYFVAKPEDLKKIENIDRSSGFFSQRTEPVVEEPCACASKYSRNFPKNNPSELLRKLLPSNDFLSFNKEPETSVMCCESHENVREETIILDFSPKQTMLKEQLPQQNLPLLPFILESFVTNKPSLPLKPKAVEIFFFPKKKELIYSDFTKNKKKELSKESIQIVGDKEIRNDFKTVDLSPPKPLQSSVKKDLGLQEIKLTTKAEGINLATAAEIPNSL